MTSDNRSCGILFLSCDKYNDLWNPLFSQFWKYWPDCPYKVFLGSNTKKYEDKRITNVLSGKDKDWSSSFLSILNHIPSKYIFLWLDDIFPISTIDASMFHKGVMLMEKRNALHIHMQPSPKPDRVYEDECFGVYDEGIPYRVNALGFWDVAYLKMLLLKGESPWNFEIMGSYRSRYVDGFYCYMKPLFKRLHVVEKGKFFKEAYDYCLINKIPIDTKKRSVLTNQSFIKSELQKIYFNIVMRINWRIRLSTMNVLRKLLISY